LAAEVIILKRGFTLIELLVVIAIIAILAAILFPVFAQAKMSAKAAASISNAKQIGLASLMYSADYDDTLVRVGNWNSGDPDAWTTAGGYATWALLQDPYQKNVGILGDPTAGSLVRGGEIARRVGTRLMSYGYNYAYLSPSYVAGGWPTPVVTMSATAANAPADTIMFGNRAAREDYNDAVFWYAPTQADRDAGRTWMIIGTVETPFCYNDPDIWCTDGWGVGSWYNTYLQNRETAGAFTGAYATRASGGMVTTFLDGHTKKLPAGQIAAGTNWNRNIANSAIIVNDVNKYIWDLK
jgi:prepilin-type N-terminal cleavage/methylation domain-containing protein